MTAVQRPGPQEFDPYYASYIDQVPDWADPILVMREQLAAVPRVFNGVSPEKAGFRYAPGKWSVREVIGHLCDTERVFSYRLMRIARGDQTALPGFDEKAYVPTGEFDRRALGSLVAEWSAIREASLALVHSLPPAAWERRGTANGKTISARALLYITPGHVAHHLEILEQRYGIGAARS